MMTIGTNCRNSITFGWRLNFSRSTKGKMRESHVTIEQPMMVSITVLEESIL